MNTQKSKLNKLTTLAIMTLPAAATAVAVAAGTGANAGDFATIETLLSDWLEGSLGTVISLGSMAVGLAMGIINQSIMSVVVGVSMAMAVAFGPGVLTSIAGAGLGF